MKEQKPLLKLKSVSKFYYNKGLVASGFNKISLEFNLGEFVVITGESGSGKSTLLNVLSGLDTYEEGEMYINGEETSHYGDNDFENYRKTYIGNIFQDFNLVNSYSVYQNIELVLLLNGYKKKDVKKKILELIKEVDLYKFKNTKVSKLSGGQKQRVAIARALAKDTPIIIADEPTGNLDSKSAVSVIKLLSNIAKDKLVIIVTHNYDQVESYATRKIEMHDGKIREDIVLKDHETYEPVVYEYENITFFNKLRLGIRNTFNIIPKFLLMFIVFLFIIAAFLGEYASYRKSVYEEGKNGYNQFFNNTDDERIVLKKHDKSALNENDINVIKSLKYVKEIQTDDLLLDNSFNINNEEYYFWGKIENNSKVNKVDVGTIPKNKNEMVIKGNRYDYYLSNELEKLFEKNFYIRSESNTILIPDQFKIVGVIYNDNQNDYEQTYYFSEEIIEKLRIGTNENYSNVFLDINGNKMTSSKYENYLKISLNKNVKKGEAIVSNELNYLCKSFSCLNNDISIKVNNIYYEEEITLKITDMYSKNNFNALTGNTNYEEFNGLIFISEEDYNELYNKYTFQSSVFVDDARNVDEVEKELSNLGYDTLAMKDAKINDGMQLLEFLKIFKLIITIGLFVVLFFIAYFVIKLIQKSRNVYYSTVRILGGSKKIIKNLISIELYTVYNLTFVLFIIFVLLTKASIINVNYLKELSTYLYISDYIIIYLLLFLMSFLLSYRYSRKLFKSSAMKSYREEV